MGWVVKDCYGAIRLGGVLVALPYTLVGRYQFPNYRPIRRPWAPGCCGKGGRKRATARAGGRVYIPHLRIEMWGTRTFVVS